MKLDITICLDSGRQISMTLAELLELRDKLKEFVPTKEPAPYYVPPLKWPPFPDWPPVPIISKADNKGV